MKMVNECGHLPQLGSISAAAAVLEVLLASLSCGIKAFTQHPFADVDRMATLDIVDASHRISILEGNIGSSRDFERLPRLASVHGDDE